MVAELHHLGPAGDRQVRLPEPAGADQDQRAGFLGAGAVEEAHQHRALQLRAQGEVELLEGGGEGDAGGLELAADRVLLPPAQLLTQQRVEELGVAALLALGLGDPRGVDLADAAELELGQLVLDPGGDRHHALPVHRPRRRRALTGRHARHAPHLSYGHIGGEYSIAAARMRGARVRSAAGGALLDQPADGQALAQ